MSSTTTSGLTERDGSVLAVSDLAGRRGRGRSTSLEVLLGLLRATSGSVRVLGHDVAGEGLQIRQRVGSKPEHDRLPPDVRRAQGAAVGATPRGRPRSLQC